VGAIDSSHYNVLWWCRVVKYQKCWYFWRDFTYNIRLLEIFLWNIQK